MPGLPQQATLLVRHPPLVLIPRVNWKYCLGLAALGLALTACDNLTRTQSPAPTPTNAAPRDVYSVTGTVVEVQLAEKYIEIQHEKIPGYMAAMTMPFDVKDTNELAGLGAGDKVVFQMIVLTNDAWIEHIRVTEKSLKGVPTTGPFRLVREVEPLEVGDPLPEYHFTNELGEAVSTTQFKGQALVLVFVFTRCPYPTFCPLTVGNLADTQRRLKAMTNGPTNWRILAVSIDPEFDTPAVLREYGQRFSYDPKSWSFLTGKLIDVTALAEQFGMTFWHENGNQLPTHNLRTVVVDANGQIQSIVMGNKWTPEDLAKGVVKAAAAKPE
jgi:protein SCO1/2